MTTLWLIAYVVMPVVVVLWGYSIMDLDRYLDSRESGESCRD